jgi:hypothetical protein
MILPFFWQFNNLSVPDEEWQQMGDCILQSMQPLKHANGATDQVTVTVFAWAEDVTLSAPTSTDPGSLAPQSGFEPQSGMMGRSNDEYGQGPVSRPASLIAKAAGALQNAPMIGTYAKATQMAASAVAGVASLFGMSRPAIIDDIVPFKPLFVGNMANTNAGDTSMRLTMDSKQELTIDPTTVGLGSMDEMAIVPLAMRESYLTQFPWAVGTVPEVLLWNCKVTPALWNENDITTPPELHLTPAAWVSLPFYYWRGSQEFRFQVVASNYHKGRIKIVYDPYFDQGSEYNTQYTYIVDIAESKDFTVKIGWASKWPYLTMEAPGAVPLPFSTTKLTGPFTNRANGMVSVYVVNDLTVPNSTINNDVAINVFTKMCDDFEVGNPDSSTLEAYSWKSLTPQSGFEDFEPQSGVETQADAEDTDHPSAPVTMETQMTIAAPLSPTDYTPDIFLGEAITSIRQILKRYNYHTSIFQTAAGLRFLKVKNNNIPYYRGFVPGAVDSAEDSEFALRPYNRCKMTTLNWYLPAYAGWRGSTRWKYVRVCERTNPTAGNITSATSAFYMKIRRDAEAESGYSITTPIYGLNAINQNTGRANCLPQKLHTWDGAFMQTAGNPVLEVELPYYNNQRFLYGKKIDYTSSSSGSRWHDFETVSAITAEGGCEIETHVSTGEDFSLFFFTGVPICFRIGAQDPSF